VVALNHFFDLEVSYQVASNEQDVAFFNQKKLNKELTAAQRVMGSRIIVMMMISSDHSLMSLSSDSDEIPHDLKKENDSNYLIMKNKCKSRHLCSV